MLGEIIERIHKFHDFPRGYILLRLEKDSFEKKFHAMYLSYLPEKQTIFDF